MNNLKYIPLFFLCFACRDKNKNANPDPIKDVPVNITINLALPSYFHMQNLGTYTYENGGVKGIIFVHHIDDNYYAFDRSCSYEPNISPCSRIEVDTAFMQFRCGESKNGTFQKCCESRFFLDGTVAQSPAKFGLRAYRVSKSGNLINITN